MDGENNGKPYEQMDDLGLPLFLETSISSSFHFFKINSLHIYSCIIFGTETKKLESEKNVDSTGCWFRHIHPQKTNLASWRIHERRGTYLLLKDRGISSLPYWFTRGLQKHLKMDVVGICWNTFRILFWDELPKVNGRNPKTTWDGAKTLFFGISTTNLNWWVYRISINIFRAVHWLFLRILGQGAGWIGGHGRREPPSRECWIPGVDLNDGHWWVGSVRHDCWRFPQESIIGRYSCR